MLPANANAAFADADVSQCCLMIAENDSADANADAAFANADV